jgi:AbrB family looped-hinge helix DNA binding protein
MTNVDITKISSKGQIVIPQDMREDLKEGEKLIIIKAGKQIILQKVKDFSKNLEEDLEFAKKTADAWKRYEKGEFISKDSESFLKELEEW